MNETGQICVESQMTPLEISFDDGCGHVGSPRSPCTPWMDQNTSRTISLPEQIYLELKQRETIQWERRNKEPRDKYLKYRRVIVKWMEEMGDDFSLSETTVHTAVAYVDQILNSIPVRKSRFQLVGMCAILIASKFEEQEDCVPLIDELTQYADNIYSYENVQRMEAILLKALDWKLRVLTPLHFLGYYETIAFDDVPLSREKERRQLKCYVDCLPTVAMEEQVFFNYPPSIIAASCIAVARQLCSISDPWPSSLCNISGYNCGEMKRCMYELHQVYVDTRPAKQVPKSSPNSTKYPIANK